MASNKDQGESLRVGYDDIELKNEKFEKYLGDLLGNDPIQTNTCLEAMKLPLPATFRVLQDDAEFERQISSLKTIGIEASPVSFCPNAWQLNTGRKAMRKSPDMSVFHSWLVDACESGQVVRQEAVSMIPPLCLQAQPGNRVLDMCAAPGSKTSQLVQAVGKMNNSLSSDHSNRDIFANSLVVANDADRNRAFMLYHQVRRLCSPCLLVTQYDATRIPKSLGQFDRVLCDVPCSGDGTIRKNNLLWRDWNPKNAIGLHPLQRRILQRGIDMMSGCPNARLVYSTCSLNPVENEAVVASILNNNSNLELLDPRPLLPGLNSRPGLSVWKVVSPDGCMLFEKYSDIPTQFSNKLKTSMFSPSNGDSLNLERCLRIYPHLQDSGGFFVALFGWRSGKAIENNQPGPATAPLSKKSKVASENLLVPIPDTLEDQLVNHFFSESISYGAFVTRSSSSKGIQFVNHAVNRLLPIVGPQGMLINAGVSIFEHYSGYCEANMIPYRLVGECLKQLGALLRPEIILDIKDTEWLISLLESNGSLTFPDSVVNDVSGCLILRYETVLIPAWCTSQRKVKAFVPKLERPFFKSALLSS